jgi:hypothetical protein
MKKIVVTVDGNKNMVTKNKLFLCIKGVNIRDIETKYELSNDSSNAVQEIGTKITRISDLSSQQSITFLGPSKQIHRCNVSMIDFSSKSDIGMLRYHCFWCKNPFNDMAIGCPISHKPSKVSKRYVSVITQNEYAISEPVMSIPVNDNSYYITDGVFCSFNCCVAYMNDNKKDPLYNNSNMLLLKMYNEMFERKAVEIPPAPHWRTITQYGGHMNITEFRESFDKVEYQNHGILMDISKKMASTSLLYEPKLKF